LTDEAVAEIRAEAQTAMREAIAAAEAEPEADPDLLFKNAYVDPPPSFTDG
jgi:TPP-dependent pyruvate/acetoin dehydrogenase alpha subunit